MNLNVSESAICARILLRTLTSICAGLLGCWPWFLRTASTFEFWAYVQAYPARLWLTCLAFPVVDWFPIHIHTTSAGWTLAFCESALCEATEDFSRDWPPRCHSSGVSKTLFNIQALVSAAESRLLSCFKDALCVCRRYLCASLCYNPELDFVQAITFWFSNNLNTLMKGSLSKMTWIIPQWLMKLWICTGDLVVGCGGACNRWQRSAV